MRFIVRKLKKIHKKPVWSIFFIYTVKNTLKNILNVVIIFSNLIFYKNPLWLLP
jgi:hypothetical protein